jgi:UDP-3-O-[3-hydroxymyristoyl] N-acetylglucosamine deacetylase/3-hydroxyacyl-[acyl-carrier-protein] dehydratase
LPISTAKWPPAAPFCFFHELEFLLDNNLIKGGDINNAIVVVDKPVTDAQVQRISKVFQKEDVKIAEGGILNNLELRFPNEPARHKLLDVMGDLALVGMPFKAHIIANRPGHASNVAFAKKVKEHLRSTRTKRRFRLTTLTSRRFTISTPLKKSCRTAIRFC